MGSVGAPAITDTVRPPPVIDRMLLDPIDMPVPVSREAAIVPVAVSVSVRPTTNVAAVLVSSAMARGKFLA
jgi:hypothetical protein